MIGDKIRELRRKFKLTQNDLSIKLNVSNGTIAMWETSKRSPDLETVDRLAKFFGVTVDYLLGREEKIIIKKIAVYGTIPAGIPTEMIDNSFIEDYEDINLNDFNPNFEYFGLKVKGDSMYPEFRNGDTLILRKQENCENGDYCAVSINHTECTFKKIIKHNNGITLQPLNPVYEPKFYTNEEVKSMPITILGIVVEVRRTYKKI
ncbi:MAG: helix-turn-helix domain-containing protein [Clostridia bacterium]|nr:helix-turn-helix domain-containing protein [Clostridia bacterium]